MKKASSKAYASQKEEEYERLFRRNLHLEVTLGNVNKELEDMREEYEEYRSRMESIVLSNEQERDDAARAHQAELDQTTNRAKEILERQQMEFLSTLEEREAEYHRGLHAAKQEKIDSVEAESLRMSRSLTLLEAQLNRKDDQLLEKDNIISRKEDELRELRNTISQDAEAVRALQRDLASVGPQVVQASQTKDLWQAKGEALQKRLRLTETRYEELKFRHANHDAAMKKAESLLAESQKQYQEKCEEVLVLSNEGVGLQKLYDEAAAELKELKETYRVVSGDALALRQALSSRNSQLEHSLHSGAAVKKDLNVTSEERRSLTAALEEIQLRNAHLEVETSALSHQLSVLTGAVREAEDDRNSDDTAAEEALRAMSKDELVVSTVAMKKKLKGLAAKVASADKLRLDSEALRDTMARDIARLQADIKEGQKKLSLAVEEGQRHKADYNRARAALKSMEDSKKAGDQKITDVLSVTQRYEKLLESATQQYNTSEQQVQPLRAEVTRLKAECQYKDMQLNDLATRLGPLEALVYSLKQELESVGTASDKSVSKYKAKCEGLSVSFASLERGMCAVISAALGESMISWEECKTSIAPHVKNGTWSNWGDAQLSKFLPAAVQLESLVLKNCKGATDAGLAALRTSNPPLRHLDLSGSMVCDISYLSGMMELQHLDLSLTPITDHSLVYLRSLGSNLKTLNLSLCGKLTDECGAYLVMLTHLKSLNLYRTSLTSVVCHHISTIGSLTSLNMSLTRINDDGLLLLASLKNLTSLDVSLSSVSVKGAAALKEALPKLTSLESSWAK